MTNSLLTIITFVPLLRRAAGAAAVGQVVQAGSAPRGTADQEWRHRHQPPAAGTGDRALVWLQQSHRRDAVPGRRALDPAAQYQLPHGRGRVERAAGLPDHIPDHAGAVLLLARHQGAGAGILLPVPAPGNGHARRLRLARSGAVLRVLGDRPGADVLPDRHLGPGEGPAAVLGHQVLPLHAGRFGLHAAGHPGHLLHHRHV